MNVSSFIEKSINDKVAKSVKLVNNFRLYDNTEQGESYV